MGDPRAHLALQEVEGEVETGGDTGTGDEVAVVDDTCPYRVDPGGVEHVQAEVVGGGVAAFQEAGHGQDEGASAHRADDHLGVGHGGPQQGGETGGERAAQQDRDGRVLLPVAGVRRGSVGLVRHGDAARGSGHEDQVRPCGVQGGRGTERQAPGAAGHLTRTLRGHEFHGDQSAGGGASRVEHFVRCDDVEGVETIEKDDLGVHREGSSASGGPVLAGVVTDANQGFRRLPEAGSPGVNGIVPGGAGGPSGLSRRQESWR